MRCVDCERPVEPRNGWTEVMGFERSRTQGGTNHVALRVPTGRMLCEGCMHLRRNKINREQGRLL